MKNQLQKQNKVVYTYPGIISLSPSLCNRKLFVNCIPPAVTVLILSLNMGEILKGKNHLKLSFAKPRETCCCN